MQDLNLNQPEVQKETKILSTQEIVRELLTNLRNHSLQYRLQVLWYLYIVVVRKQLRKVVMQMPGARFLAVIPVETKRLVQSVELPCIPDWIVECVNVILLALATALSYIALAKAEFFR